MRNLFFLLLISASSVWARDVYSQGAQEMFSVKSGTIESIFKQIKKQSDYEFFYNTAILDVKQNVMLTSTSGTLDEILAQVLGKKYEYQVKDNYVLISEKKVSTPDEVKKVTIKGVVKDKKGELLPGVSVLLKGTVIGVATDVKGEFTLVIPEQEKIMLMFTFIGMKTKTIEYKKQEKPIVVILEDNVTEMDEVVVTGYQEIKKTRMTGSVEVVTSKDIANKGYTSIEDVLKGQMAGVAVMNLSGRPGAQATIRIRGINSLTGDTDPIWIIDGMPLSGDVPEISMGGTEFQETVLTSGIGNIPPDDIESITVLKDAAATAIYGSRAANGVIVVTTKRGAVGRSYINIQASYGLSEAPGNRLKMMNTKEKIAARVEKTLEDRTQEQGRTLEELLPDSLRNLLNRTGLMENLRGALERQAESTIAATARAIAAAVARELVESFAYAILYVLLFLALGAVLHVASLGISMLLRLPLLSSANTLGGALLGLLEGMIVVWLLIWLIPHFGVELPTENTYLLRFFTAVGPLSLLSSL